MVDIFVKMMQKLNDINQHVNKKIMTEKRKKELYGDIDDVKQAEKKLVVSIDLINESKVDEIEYRFFMDIGSNLSRATSLIDQSKELLELFIGKYRKEIERLERCNDDE